MVSSIHEHTYHTMSSSFFTSLESVLSSLSLAVCVSACHLAQSIGFHLIKINARKHIRFPSLFKSAAPCFSHFEHNSVFFDAGIESRTGTDFAKSFERIILHLMATIVCYSCLMFINPFGNLLMQMYVSLRGKNRPMRKVAGRKNSGENERK